MLNRLIMKAKAASFPTSEIMTFKARGWSNDAIYNRAAGVLGLYGVAFFGHKGTKVQKQKLNRTWKRILAAESPDNQ
jgi:hypothetical protein